MTSVDGCCGISTFRLISADGATPTLPLHLGRGGGGEFRGEDWERRERGEERRNKERGEERRSKERERYGDARGGGEKGGVNRGEKEVGERKKKITIV